MTRFRHLIIRPSVRPGPPLPVAGRSVGHYRLRPGEGDSPTRIPYVQVYWGVAGTGRQRLGQQTLEIPPEHVACCPPGRLRVVAAGDGFWEYRWWTLDGPRALRVVRDFGLEPGRVLPAGPAPVERFRALDAAIREVTPAGEYRASAIAYELLARAAAGGREAARAADPLVVAARARIQAEWSDPDFAVADLARRLGVHRSLLSRRFRAGTGIAPSAYLAQLRLQAALIRLDTTDRPVAAIARACGWSDPAYFARCIARATGCSPRAYRRRGR